MEKVAFTAKDIQQLIGVSLPTVYNLFNTEGFPVVCVGRKKIVPRDAFFAWLNEQAKSVESGR